MLKLQNFINRYRVDGIDYKIYKQEWGRYLVVNLNDETEESFHFFEDAVDYIFEKRKNRPEPTLATPKQAEYIQGMCEYLDCEESVLNYCRAESFSQITRSQASKVIPVLQKAQREQMDCDAAEMEGTVDTIRDW